MYNIYSPKEKFLTSMCQGTKHSRHRPGLSEQPGQKVVTLFVTFFLVHWRHRFAILLVEAFAVDEHVKYLGKWTGFINISFSSGDFSLSTNCWPPLVEGGRSISVQFINNSIPSGAGSLFTHCWSSLVKGGASGSISVKRTHDSRLKICFIPHMSR